MWANRSPGDKPCVRVSARPFLPDDLSLIAAFFPGAARIFAPALTFALEKHLVIFHHATHAPARSLFCECDDGTPSRRRCFCPVGFGRASAEVGAVIIVGGNINHVTRVMTTTIALETSKGNLPLALGLGIILLLLTFMLNAAAMAIRDVAKRTYG